MTARFPRLLSRRRHNSLRARRDRELPTGRYGLPSRPTLTAGLLAYLFLAVTLLWSTPAEARSIFRRPGLNPHKSFELEPHLTLSNQHLGVGPGFRATIVVLDRGFLKRFNDSFGISFGGDIVLSGRCDRDETFPFCGRRAELVLPVAGQWSFWFTERWGAFVEAGVAVSAWDTPRLRVIEPKAAAGARAMFGDSFGLTLRVGAPISSIGLSFYY